MCIFNQTLQMSENKKVNQLNFTDADSLKTDDETVLKQQQQRLLLLRHASRCRKEGNCDVTPHCALMQALWKHISTCKLPRCEFKYCVSSRHVLSHYHRCRSETCQICEPVRSLQRNQRRITDESLLNNLNAQFAAAHAKYASITKEWREIRNRQAHNAMSLQTESDSKREDELRIATSETLAELSAILDQLPEDVRQDYRSGFYQSDKPRIIHSTTVEADIMSISTTSSAPFPLLIESVGAYESVRDKLHCIRLVRQLNVLTMEEYKGFLQVACDQIHKRIDNDALPEPFVFDLPARVKRIILDYYAGDCFSNTFENVTTKMLRQCPISVRSEHAIQYAYSIRKCYQEREHQVDTIMRNKPQPEIDGWNTVASANRLALNHVFVQILERCEIIKNL